MDSFFFNEPLSQIDPDVDFLNEVEAERQKRKLIMIASESFAPLSVRESLASRFQNIYAEGYPPEETRFMNEAEILNYPERLTEYRRNSDPRYYKGVEYADTIEALARRRCAELFANARVSADQIQVNVQPLSGAPANNAAYHLIQPGDTVLAMDLLHGGHLTHGSPVNRTGQLYNIVHYTVDPQTEKLDYDEIQRLATECQPKMIIAGYTSFPYIPDWKQYRKIADSVGALLLTDIAHIAGLVAAGVVPSPVGVADVVSFTTHKTLTGPRAAVILTTNPKYAKEIDKAVFPGEQGGPHMHAVAALATIFKIAKQPEYKEYQKQILANCQALIKQVKERGVRVSYGGSDSHMFLIDCKPIVGEDGATLTGDMAARIFDNAGIVLNRNTIPGDKSALRASGMRIGLPCATQIGLKENDMIELGNIIADLLFAIKPYKTYGAKGMLLRAKVDFKTFQSCKLRIRNLAAKGGTFSADAKFGYPHFFYLDDPFKSAGGKAYLKISGPFYREFANLAFRSDIETIKSGESKAVELCVDGELVSGELGLSENGYVLAVPSEKAGLTAAWLRDLSDGFVYFDGDRRTRLPERTIIAESEPIVFKSAAADEEIKPFAIGLEPSDKPALPEFDFAQYDRAENPIKFTPLHELHVAAKAKMAPFAGYEMPLWYSSVKDEHRAVRTAVGLFDVTHMGVYMASGPSAQLFLNCVVPNDIDALNVGDTVYTHLLTPDGDVIDDLIIYRVAEEEFMIVVNAANDDKDWAWLNAVKNGSVIVDRKAPNARAFGRDVILEDLRNPKSGDRQRVDIALQGRASIQILEQFDMDSTDRAKLQRLVKGKVIRINIGGYDVIISRTGYTGEKFSFEIFVHPEKVASLWQDLLNIGSAFGILPCGLAARDSLRIESGLPLYGHELAGPQNYKLSEVGFSHFVKIYKPWFIGRDAFLAEVEEKKRLLIRFTIHGKSQRLAQPGDPLFDDKGKVVGIVTSCSIDSEGGIVGLAMVDFAQSAEGTEFVIYQNAARTTLKKLDELKIGDRQPLPGKAVALRRYPRLG